MKILITGAASGIGYLTALTLAERKHEVYLTCENNKQVKNVKEKVLDYKNINVMKINITKQEDRKRVLDLNIDCLISNAAIAQGGSIIEANIDKMRENFEVNVFSNFELVKEVLKQMVEKDKGRVVMISSLIANIPLPFTGIYSATKASISNITYTLRKELWLMGSNVGITLVEPGLYHTGFNQVLLENKYDDGKYFEDIKKELYNVEHFAFKTLEKKSLDSIVIKIVRAVEDEKPKSVYRAPLFQSIMGKIYNIFKK